MGIDFSFGIGRAFNIAKNEGVDDFAETVLATNLAFAKFWWLSGSTSLGVSLMSGLYGFNVREGKFGSIGLNIGLGFTFLLG